MIWTMWSILFLALELAGIVVLLKGILGFSFSKNKKWLTAGILMFVLSIAIERVIIPNGGTLLYWLMLIVPSAGVAMLFQGRKSTLFLISGCMLSMYSHAESLGLGVGILLRKGVDIINMNMELNAVIADILILAVTSIFFFVFRKKNRNFRSYTESLNGAIFVCFWIYSRLAEYRPWTVAGNLSAQMLAEVECVRGWNLIKYGISDLTVFLSVVLICILVSQHKAMVRMLRLNEKCIAEQTEQYRLLSRGDRELRRFRHDYNGHITVLRDLADEGNVEKLKRYVESLQEAREKFKCIRTNNIVCDAILNQYFVLCRDAGFELQVKGSFPDQLEIAETDLCVVLSNGVKNACEAALQCEEGRRKLNVEISGRGVFVYITICNSADRAPIIENGRFVTAKKDKINHGLGTQNMIDTARKAGGDVCWQYADGEVQTEITLKEKTE